MTAVVVAALVEVAEDSVEDSVVAVVVVLEVCFFIYSSGRMVPESANVLTCLASKVVPAVVLVAAAVEALVVAVAEVVVVVPLVVKGAVPRSSL